MVIFVWLVSIWGDKFKNKILKNKFRKWLKKRVIIKVLNLFIFLLKILFIDWKYRYFVKILIIIYDNIVCESDSI